MRYENYNKLMIKVFFHYIKRKLKLYINLFTIKRDCFFGNKLVFEKIKIKDLSQKECIQKYYLLFNNYFKKSNISKYNTLPKSVYGFGHYKFYDHVFQCLSNHINSEFEANEAIKTVKLINAIYKSIETKKEILFKKNINSKKLGK